MKPVITIPPEITTVWLDLDDTIIDFHANSRRSLAELYLRRDLGRFYPGVEEWIECYERHNHALWDEYNRAAITSDYLRVERFSRPLMDAGCSRDDAYAMSREFDSEYLDILAHQRKLVKGALTLLRKLHNAGYRVGVLSNGFKDVQHRKIRNARIAPWIEMVVLSDDIGVNKPDRRIFIHAMDMSGDLDPKHHMMIGDNPATDIAGALAAGWDAILLDHKGTNNAECAVVRGLDQIKIMKDRLQDC